ncbi:MAG: hypothetical protein ACP5NZ_04450 [Nanobdellota archaeon]
MGKKEAINKGEVKTFLLEIPEDIWEKWKNTVPRSISLNKALIELLKKEGDKNGK